MRGEKSGLAIISIENIWFFEVLACDLICKMLNPKLKAYHTTYPECW
jgi:hypothetical protein